MAIVTVKNKYQVIIPQAIREKLGISRNRSATLTCLDPNAGKVELFRRYRLRDVSSA
jgi:bifunctional DNA-binding transcriptional regulator/antitoxin component of YhaV-PrlF toxin-antitoxin module